MPSISLALRHGDGLPLGKYHSVDLAIGLVVHMRKLQFQQGIDYPHQVQLLVGFDRQKQMSCQLAYVCGFDAEG